MRRALLVILAAGLASQACGPSRRGVPFGAPLRLEGEAREGERLYMRYCNSCHPGGAGGLGPALANKPLPPFAIRAQIREGVGAMPSFSEEELSDAEVDAIVAYVNALQETPGLF